MKDDQKVIEFDTYEEDVQIHPECMAECDYGENDWDGYYICTSCEKTDFQGEIKTTEGKKKTVSITYLEL